MISRPLFAAALVLCSIASSASGQLQLPPKRAHHAMVYDDARHIVLLTTGSTPLDGGQRFQFFNDQWAFDKSGWRPLAESGERISGIGITYDGKRRHVISFGGYNGQSLSDLRQLDGDQWRVLARHPEAAAEPGFVYDARRDRFVTFGGSAGPGQTGGETWEYDGTAWQRIAGDGPPPRQAHTMAYDTRRGVTVLFGGMGAGPMGQRRPALGDTWEFDGTRWTRRTGEGPSARSAAGVAYDSKRGLVIIFGGMGTAGFLGDTWSWDGTTWRQIATTGPEPRAMGYMAYDRLRDRIVMFGGRKGWPDGDLNDTWEWDGKAWQRFTP